MCIRDRDREQAFRVTDVAESIEEVVKEIERIEGQDVYKRQSKYKK